MASDLIQQFITAKGRILASQYTVLASFTLYAYDIWITLDDEIEFVFKRKLWSFPAILYLGNRFCTFIALLFASVTIAPYTPPLSRGLCQEGLVPAFYCIATVCWSGIMSLRVAALWKSNVPVVWVVWILWAIFSIWSTVRTLVIFIEFAPGLEYNNMLKVCAPKINKTVQPHLQAAGPAVQFVFILILTTLTVLKAWHLRNPFDVLGISSIVNVLLHDGILYLSVVTGLSFATSLCWFLIPDAADRIYLLTYINWAIFSVLVGRFFIRLRKAYQESLTATSTCKPSTTYDTASFSHMFARPEREEGGFFYYDDFAAPVPVETATEQEVGLDLLPSLKRDVEAPVAPETLEEESERYSNHPSRF